MNSKVHILHFNWAISTIVLPLAITRKLRRYSGGRGGELLNSLVIIGCFLLIHYRTDFLPLKTERSG